MNRRTPIAALIAVALLVSGCGRSADTKDSAGQFTGEPRAVAQTVEDLQKAGDKRKQDEICDHLLSKSLVDQITKATKKSCADAVDKALQDVDAFDLQVLAKGVTVKGTTATAKVRSKNGDKSNVSTLGLVKEDGRWKVSTLSDAPPAT